MKKILLTSLMMLMMGTPALAASPFMVTQSAQHQLSLDDHKTVVHKPASTLAQSLIKCKLTDTATGHRQDTEQQPEYSAQSRQAPR